MSKVHSFPCFDRTLENNLIFMQDNAQIYITGNFKIFLEKHKILCLNYCAQLPGLNPIENECHHIKQLLRNDKSINLEEL